MSDWVALAIPAVAAGLFGSAHCLGMCGGLSGLFAMHTGARSTASQPLLAVTYNLGRIASYATLGALSAYAGQGLTDVLPGLAVPIRLAAGLVIVLMGIQIAFGWQLLGPVEKVGSYLWRLVSPLTKHVLPVTSPPKALALGLLWGLLPCGLLYSMLAAAWLARLFDAAGCDGRLRSAAWRHRHGRLRYRHDAVDAADRARRRLTESIAVKQAPRVGGRTVTGRYRCRDNGDAGH